MPRVVETLWASLGKSEKQQHAEYVQVGTVMQHSDGSRYVVMKRLFNYGLLPSNNPKRFYLQVRSRQPGEEG